MYNIYMNKVCTKCKVEKPIDSFSWKSIATQKRASECKDCHVVMRKTYYENNKPKEKKRIKARKEEIKTFFRELKKTLSCEICSESTPICLDFHHNDSSEKDFNVSQASFNGLSRDTIRKEIDKCTVLCANCHRKRHAGLV